MKMMGQQIVYALASLRLCVFALNLNKLVTKNLKVGIHRVSMVLPEDIDFNAKTRRRSAATQAGEAARLYRINLV
jgi:hypothetical protein